jgi:hypothetical protein
VCAVATICDTTEVHHELVERSRGLGEKRGEYCRTEGGLVEMGIERDVMKSKFTLCGHCPLTRSLLLVTTLRPSISDTHTVYPELYILLPLSSPSQQRACQSAAKVSAGTAQWLPEPKNTVSSSTTSRGLAGNPDPFESKSGRSLNQCRSSSQLCRVLVCILGALRS